MTTRDGRPPSFSPGRRLEDEAELHAASGECLIAMMLRLVPPGLYLAMAVYAWIDFVRLPKDGLATVGLMLVTFPVTILGLILTELKGGGTFVLLPDGFGYYADHALYYWPSVDVTTLLLYFIARAFSL